MKKRLLIALLAATALTAAAQEQETESRELPVDLSTEIGLYSAYVWRGIIVNDHAVLQPSITAEKGPFSFNVWGNWNLDQPAGRDDDLEVDYTAAYTLPINNDNISVDVGVIYYTFPGDGSGTPNTAEIFTSAAFPNVVLTPVASVYYDIDEVNGWYGNLAVSQGMEFTEALTGELGASVGYGTRNYNRYYFQDNLDNGSGNVNDYNIYLSGSYALTSQLSMGALLQYSYLDGGVVAAGEQNNILWGGVNLSYTF